VCPRTDSKDKTKKNKITKKVAKQIITNDITQIREKIFKSQKIEPLVMKKNITEEIKRQVSKA
jgi:hypothetical protein